MNIIKETLLFNGINESNIESLIKTLDGFKKSYLKDEIIYTYTQPLEHVGLVLSGEIGITLLNLASNVQKIHTFEKGDLFGEAYACLPPQRTPIEVKAIKDTCILFLNLKKLFSEDLLYSETVSKVKGNLLQAMATMNTLQMEKIETLSQKTIRDKICLLITNNYCRHGNRRIPIKNTKQEIANRIGANRSALIRELSKMRDEGLIEYDRNTLIISDKLLMNLPVS